MACIYKVVNAANEVIYIGQTRGDIAFREEWYQREVQRGGTRPINRYFGIAPIKLQLQELCRAEELDERERFWIRYYANKRPLLNIADNPHYNAFVDACNECKANKDDLAHFGIQWFDYNTDVASLYDCIVNDLD